MKNHHFTKEYWWIAAYLIVPSPFLPSKKSIIHVISNSKTLLLPGFPYSPRHGELHPPGYMYKLWGKHVGERDLRILIDWWQFVYGSTVYPEPITSCGASGTALSAGWWRLLSCSALHWCSLTFNIVCSFGHYNVRSLSDCWSVSREGNQVDKRSWGVAEVTWFVQF